MKIKKFTHIQGILFIFSMLIGSVQAVPINIADYPSEIDVINQDTMKMRKIKSSGIYYWVIFNWKSSSNGWMLGSYGIDNLPLSQINVVASDESVGSYNSLALTSKGIPKISYYDDTNDNLVYADWKGDYWLLDVVDSVGSVGRYTSLALDSNNYPHISYYDDSNDDLKYAVKDHMGWHTETIDFSGNVGQHTSIALDPTTGHPRISYFD